MKSGHHPYEADPGEAERAFQNATREWRRVIAEAWGTYLLVLAAAGGHIASAVSGEFTPSIAAVGPGLIVMAVIYFMGSVSGAHLNPAVSFAFALRGNFPWSRVPGYILAQIVGAVLASAFLAWIFGDLIEKGATVPKNGVTSMHAFVLEAILTAGLVNTILGTASGARNVGTNAGIAVGGYIALAGLWASSFTGASMNPARSLGPDLVRGDFSTSWIYIIGPVAGAMIGVGLERIFKGPPTKSGSKAAQGEDS